MFTGFKNFLMRGDIVVVAVGLAVALAFSALIASFTANIINPIVARAQGGHSIGLGVQLGNAGKRSTFLNFGSLISSLIYFLVFMLVVYYVIVVPYRRAQARRGVTVFGLPGLPVQRPAGQGRQVQVLRHGAAFDRRGLIAASPPVPPHGGRPHPGLTWRRRSWSPRPS